MGKRNGKNYNTDNITGCFNFFENLLLFFLLFFLVYARFTVFDRTSLAIFHFSYFYSEDFYRLSNCMHRKGKLVKDKSKSNVNLNLFQMSLSQLYNLINLWIVAHKR
jgi:hypothetical protein